MHICGLARDFYYVRAQQQAGVEQPLCRVLRHAAEADEVRLAAADLTRENLVESCAPTRKDIYFEKEKHIRLTTNFTKTEKISKISAHKNFREIIIN